MLGRMMISDYQNIGQNDDIAVTLMLGGMMISDYHNVGQNDDKR